MRIIFARAFATAAILGLLAPVRASDLEYSPERVKRYASFQKCLAALREKQLVSKSEEKTVTEETQNRRTVTTITVRDIEYRKKNEAGFSIQGRSATVPKGEVDSFGAHGGHMGWGTDWYCAGRVMWKGGGHSAWVPSYYAPPPPPLPPIPPMPEPPPAPATPES